MGRRPKAFSKKRLKTSRVATLLDKFRDLRRPILLRNCWTSWTRFISKGLPSLAIPRKWFIIGTIFHAWVRVTARSTPVCVRVCHELLDRQWTRCFLRRIFCAMRHIFWRGARASRMEKSHHKRLLRVVGLAWAKWTFMRGIAAVVRARKIQILEPIFKALQKVLWSKKEV